MAGELPAVSLYLDLDEQHAVRGHHTRLERVPMVANLRHAQYDVLNEAFENGRSAGCRTRRTCARCGASPARWRRKRGRPSAGASLDYTFTVAGRPRAHRSAQARRAARQAGVRDDDRRQLDLGRAARRARRGGHLPRAVDRQGALQRAPRGPRRPWRVRLCVDELAAAALRRPHQPMAARRGRGRAQATVHRALRTPSSARCAPSRSPTLATTSTSARWRPTGACAGCSRKESAR